MTQAEGILLQCSSFMNIIDAEEVLVHGESVKEVLRFSLLCK